MEVTWTVTWACIGTFFCHAQHRQFRCEDTAHACADCRVKKKKKLKLSVPVHVHRYPFDGSSEYLADAAAKLRTYVRQSLLPIPPTGQGRGLDMATY